MLVERIKELTEIFIREFGSLTVRQLNWKASRENWSIGQCIHHLIVSNEIYFPVLNKIRSGKYTMTFWEKHNPFSHYTGRKMVNTLGPLLTRKYKSPLLFHPSASEFNEGLMQDFTDHQNKLIDLIVELENENYNHIVMTSPVAGLITFPVHDGLRLIVAHEERHLNQAMEIKSNSLFPQQ